MECIFCNIVQKKLPAQLSYEDEQVIAFNDLHPRAPVHLLIIPRRHIASLNEVTPENNQLLGHILQTAAQLAHANGIAAPGYRLVNNCNSGGGQTVFHLHFHLLGGRTLGWPPG